MADWPTIFTQAVSEAEERAQTRERTRKEEEARRAREEEEERQPLERFFE